MLKTTAWSEHSIEDDHDVYHNGKTHNWAMSLQSLDLLTSNQGTCSCDSGGNATECEDDLKLALGPGGCRHEPHVHKGSSTAQLSGIELGQQNHSSTRLGLSLAPYGDDDLRGSMVNICLTSPTQAALNMKETLWNVEPEVWVNDFPEDETIRHGRLHSSSMSVGETSRSSNFLHSHCPSIGDKNSLSALTVTSSDAPGVVRLKQLYYDHIPLVDEGSTSARCMKSGGCMPSLLQNAHLRVHEAGLLSQETWKLESCRQQDYSIGTNESSVLATDYDPLTNVSSQTTQGVTALSTLDKPSKICKFPGCSKCARGASGLCIGHGGGQRCQRPNCNKGAEGCTLFCKAHGGGRRCQTLGCVKSAEGRTDFCIAHGGGRRCSYEGCSKAARGRSGLCIRHGGGKRCQREGCPKSAEGQSGLCISHGGGRRCHYPDCGKGAQGSTKFCKAHGGGRRCMFEGCTKGAEGSTFLCKAHGGGKRCMFGGGTCTKSVHGGTLYCVAHGGGKRCAVTGCTKSARGRTDFCVRHGGGRRCKFHSCNKSAQGNTDFCKAHGGGKRCCWGQLRSLYSSYIFSNSSAKDECDGLARGKSGLCAAHTALLQQLKVFEDYTIHSSTAKVKGDQNMQLVYSKAQQLYLGSADKQFPDVADGHLPTHKGCDRDGYSEQNNGVLARNSSFLGGNLVLTEYPALDVDSHNACGENASGCFLLTPGLQTSSHLSLPIRSPSFGDGIGESSPCSSKVQEDSVRHGTPTKKSSKSSSTLVGASNTPEDDIHSNIQQLVWNHSNVMSDEMHSFFGPEERVHGGSLMALFAKHGF